MLLQNLLVLTIFQQLQFIEITSFSLKQENGKNSNKDLDKKKQTFFYVKAAINFKNILFIHFYLNFYHLDLCIFFLSVCIEIFSLTWILSLFGKTFWGKGLIYILLLVKIFGMLSVELNYTILWQLRKHINFLNYSFSCPNFWCRVWKYIYRNWRMNESNSWNSVSLLVETDKNHKKFWWIYVGKCGILGIFRRSKKIWRKIEKFKENWRYSEIYWKVRKIRGSLRNSYQPIPLQLKNLGLFEISHTSHQKEIKVSHFMLMNFNLPVNKTH